MKRWWVRNADLKRCRGRDNPKEVVLAHEVEALLAAGEKERDKLAKEVEEDAGIMKVLRRRAKAAEADAAKWKLLIGPGGMNALAAAEAERDKLLALLREARERFMQFPGTVYPRKLLSRIDAALEEKP